MSGKDEIENISNNTYGIEIEFATHDCEMLSFTHIEVWNLYPKPGDNGGDSEKCKKNGWKIETDADYTLELVSPILQFTNQKAAREYKKDLMAKLQELVQKGTLLVELIEQIEDLLVGDFQYDTVSGFWKYDKNSRKRVSVGSEFITAEDLIENEGSNSLNWFNWDEDSNLEQVLAAKKILGVKKEYWTNTLNSILLTPSRKHGGLPSSQMNLPLSLFLYERYVGKYKADKAWSRLLKEEVEKPDYKKDMQKKLEEAYPGLADNSPSSQVWKAKYLNDDYLDAQIDAKTPIWHRYWLWLNTFDGCARQLYYGDKNLQENANIYKGDIDSLIKNSKFLSLKEAQKKIKEKEIELLPKPLTVRNELTYLSIQKLVSGTLSEMSEEQQGIAQKRVMELNGDMDMDDILSAFPGKAFFHFHYALKDLTPLWFKSPLMDVIDREEDALTFCEWFKKLAPNDVAYVITTVLEANLSLLGWYYGVAKANNQPFDYDWDDFLSYNMPSVTAFGAELLKTCVEFNDYIKNYVAIGGVPKVSKVIATIDQLPQDEVVFLKRNYGNKGSIARWEGRWDTMKAPILIKYNFPRYLIEHRNN